jgi:hypothetical protein
VSQLSMTSCRRAAFVRTIAVYNGAALAPPRLTFTLLCWDRAARPIAAKSRSSV